MKRVISTKPNSDEHDGDVDDGDEEDDDGVRKGQFQPNSEEDAQNEEVGNDKHDEHEENVDAGDEDDEGVFLHENEGGFTMGNVYNYVESSP